MTKAYLIQASHRFGIVRVTSRVPCARVSSRRTKTNFNSKHDWICANCIFSPKRYRVELIRPALLFRPRLMIFSYIHVRNSTMCIFERDRSLPRCIVIVIVPVFSSGLFRFCISVIGVICRCLGFFDEI